MARYVFFVLFVFLVVELPLGQVVFLTETVSGMVSHFDVTAAVPMNFASDTKLTKVATGLNSTSGIATVGHYMTPSFYIAVGGKSYLDIDQGRAFQGNFTVVENRTVRGIALASSRELYLGLWADSDDHQPGIYYSYVYSNLGYDVISTPVLKALSSCPGSLAIHSDKVYLLFTDVCAGTINALQLQGGNANPEVVVRHLFQPKALAFNGNYDRIFFVANYAIMSANVVVISSGNSMGVTVTGLKYVVTQESAGILSPIGLAVVNCSGGHEKLYWSDSCTHFVQRSEMNGSNVELVIYSAPSVVGLAFSCFAPTTTRTTSSTGNASTSSTNTTYTTSMSMTNTTPSTTTTNASTMTVTATTTNTTTTSTTSSTSTTTTSTTTTSTTTTTNTTTTTTTTSTTTNTTNTTLTTTSTSTSTTTTASTTNTTSTTSTTTSTTTTTTSTTTTNTTTTTSTTSTSTTTTTSSTTTNTSTTTSTTTTTTSTTSTTTSTSINFTTTNGTILEKNTTTTSTTSQLLCSCGLPLYKMADTSEIFENERRTAETLGSPICTTTTTTKPPTTITTSTTTATIPGGCIYPTTPYGVYSNDINGTSPSIWSLTCNGTLGKMPAPHVGNFITCTGGVFTPDPIPYCVALTSCDVSTNSNIASLLVDASASTCGSTTLNSGSTCEATCSAGENTSGSIHCVGTTLFGLSYCNGDSSLTAVPVQFVSGQVGLESNGTDSDFGDSRASLCAAFGLTASCAYVVKSERTSESSSGRRLFLSDGLSNLDGDVIALALSEWIDATGHRRLNSTNSTLNSSFTHRMTYSVAVPAASDVAVTNDPSLTVKNIASKARDIAEDNSTAQNAFKAHLGVYIGNITTVIAPTVTSGVVLRDANGNLKLASAASPGGGSGSSESSSNTVIIILCSCGGLLVIICIALLLYRAWRLDMFTRKHEI